MNPADSIVLHLYGTPCAQCGRAAHAITATGRVIHTARTSPCRTSPINPTPTR